MLLVLGFFFRQSKYVDMKRLSLTIVKANREAEFVCGFYSTTERVKSITLSFNDYGLHNNKMFINRGVHNVKIS